MLGGLAVIDRGSGDRRPFRAPAAGDFTLQGRANETSVLVLGAGVAGLACAYELEKAGYAVTVLEARGRTGGRNLTVRPGTELTDTRGTTQRADLGEGRWFNAGPARIAAHHTTIDYCRELGVAIEPFVNVNVDAYVVANGEVRRRRSLDADLDGYVAELLTKAIPSRSPRRRDHRRREGCALRLPAGRRGHRPGRAGLRREPGRRGAGR